MSIPLEALEAQVLSLPPRDRSHLLDRLIASLDADQAIEEAWKKEAKRRDDEMEAGKAEELDLDDVLTRLRATLK